MIYIIIALVLVVAVLCYALYYQIKGSKDQASEQEALLRDYQRRVDEQQQLLKDYRSLQENFDNVGEGYEQALELYDKMEENSRKLEERNTYLENQNKELQTANNSHSEALRQHQEFFQQLIQDLENAVDKLDPAVSGPVAGLVYKMKDATEMGSDTPIERVDNIVAEQVAKRAVAESAIDQCQYFTFQLTVTPQAASMLQTDEKRAAHALALVLDNAKKFTTDGTVQLMVDADLQESKITYAVTDTGMGVPAQEAERIFEPNVKLNSYFDGQGLGLTFARSIARRLGGGLVLDTTHTDKGARFVMTLPM
jgi:signal transduction histidine kinase